MKYICDPHIYPAIMPDNVGELSLYSELCAPLSTHLHLDVMDGLFAPTMLWPLNTPEYERDVQRLPQVLSGMRSEAHLMMVEPQSLAELLARNGVERILVHREVYDSPASFIRARDLMREAGAREVGIVFNIDTSLDDGAEFIAAADVVQLMSIAEIGHQGKPFDDRVLSRIEELHAMYPDTLIAVDGGVGEATIEEVVRAGANRLIVGGALRHAPDTHAMYRKLEERARRGCEPIHA